MVAVVFHGGFHFELPAVMDQILTLESDEFPDWDSLSDAVQLTPWARDLAKTLPAATARCLVHDGGSRP
jgi:hypothetical protein